MYLIIHLLNIYLIYLSYYYLLYVFFIFSQLKLDVERDNEEDKEKCEEQRRESFAFGNDEGVRQRLEKEDKDANDLSEQHDSYELKWDGERDSEEDKKQNMSEKINKNKSNTINPKHPKHTSSHKTYAKSTYSTIPPSKKQILKSSTTSSHHTINESFNNHLQETIIIPRIITLPKHSSAIKTSHQKYISKTKEKVENLKIKNLIPSLPYVTSSTNRNRLETNSKYSKSTIPTQQLLSQVTNGTFHTSLVPSVPHTVDHHDQKKFPIPRLLPVAQNM